MKKITLVALLGLSSSLVASDSPFYVGIESGNNKINHTFKNTVNVPVTSTTRTTTSTTKESESGQTLKVGYYLNNNSRGYGFYQAGEVDTYGIGYDYIFGDNKLKPFVGIVAGKADYKAMDSTVYGGQIGVDYILNNNFSLEVGYSYLKTNMDVSNTSSDTYLGNPATLTETSEVDSIKKLFVGINYRF